VAAAEIIYPYNNMKLKNSIKLCVFLFTIAACKKSDSGSNSITLSGTYTSSETRAAGNLYMYTINGQVTNQDVIKTYMANHPDSLSGISQFLASGAKGPLNTNGLQVNFVSDGTAVCSLAKSTNSETTNFTITQKTNAGFLLESADT
jgi:hypothetical protein